MVVVAGQVSIGLVDAVPGGPNVAIGSECPQVAFHVTKSAAGDIRNVDAPCSRIAQGDTVFEGRCCLGFEVATGVITTADDVVRSVASFIDKTIAFVPGTVECSSGKRY